MPKINKQYSEQVERYYTPNQRKIMENKELTGLRNQCGKLEKQIKKHLKGTLKLYSSLLDDADRADTDSAVTLNKVLTIIAAQGLQTARVYDTLGNSDLSVQELAKGLKQINNTPTIKVKKENK